MREEWLAYLESIESSVKKLLAETERLKLENAGLKQKLEQVLVENTQQKKMIEGMEESNNFINIATGNANTGFDKKRIEEEIDAAIAELNECINMLNN